MAVQGNDVIRTIDVNRTIVIAAMEEIRKKGRPRKRWRDEIEEDLNKMVIKKGREWSGTVGNGGIFRWKPKVCKGR